MTKKKRFIRIFLIVLFVSIVLAIASPRVPGLPQVAQSKLDKLKMNLGLDLQGGLHLEYAMDLSAVDADQKDEASDAVQAVVERRVNAFGVGEPLVAVARRGTERYLIVELPGIRDVEQAKSVIKETPFLEFREERTEEELAAKESVFNAPVKQQAEEVFARVQSGEDFGALAKEFSQDDVSRETNGFIDFTEAGTLVEEFDNILFNDNIAQNTVYPEIVQTQYGYHIIKKGDVREEDGKEQEVSAYHILFATIDPFRVPQLAYKPTELTGKYLEESSVSFSGHGGVSEPQVVLQFDSAGSSLFGELTKRNLEKTIAIFIDDVLVSAPVVRAEITNGEAVISGNFGLEEAKTLSGRLNEGALPVPIELVSQQSIKASLGAEALATSAKAGAIGLFFVMIYMIVYYRFLGLIAAGTIGVYAVVIIALFKLSSAMPSGLSITLTLAGIAGLILSIGMAVDANILIFERIREELQRGRNLKHAIDEGFNRAWSAIRDGSLSTILTSLILMTIGTGFVKGFALILIIGVLVSLFTAVVLVRVTLQVGLGAFFEKHLWLLIGHRAHKDERFDIIGKRKYTYIFSVVVIFMSIAALSFIGLRPGIDFVGGTIIEVERSAKSTLSRDTMCQHLSGEICTESFIVQESEDNRLIVRYKNSDDTVNKQVMNAMQVVDADLTILRTDFIGATISKQLKENTFSAILLAISVILLYIAWAFRKISFPVSSWSYGFAAVVALVHDIIIVLGIFAVIGYFVPGAEVSIPFVAALLTILGYSVNDTIVVYDRLRENIMRTKDTEHFEKLVNRSLNEVLSRSMNTSLTVVAVLVAIIIWGSSSLLWFALTLLFGVIVGTYSSIYIASALVLSIYEYKVEHRLLGRVRKVFTPKKGS